MDDLSNREQAVDLLQRLGLKEYESKVFVALARLPHGTAKEISDLSEVPRTRIYDAVRVLESKGLVETQHSNPQRFRAVSTEEAVNILVAEYESRTATLREALEGLDPAPADDAEVTHEVWALSGSRGIEERTAQLLENAQQEVVLVLGTEDVFTDTVRDLLEEAVERDLDVVVGTSGESIREQVQTAVPGAEVFVSGLGWLESAGIEGDDTEISRLLLVDQSTILVSTRHQHGTESDERAVFGRGFDNGLVTIVRRLMATGLLPSADPDRSESAP